VTLLLQNPLCSTGRLSGFSGSSGQSDPPLRAPRPPRCKVGASLGQRVCVCMCVCARATGHHCSRPLHLFGPLAGQNNRLVSEPLERQEARRLGCVWREAGSALFAAASRRAAGHRAALTLSLSTCCSPPVSAHEARAPSPPV